jgi:hypothetical protein
MNEDFDHGPRLTGEEYEKRIIELYRDLPPEPSKEQEKQVLRQELELAIDHRLGQNFPLNRREALWAINERADKTRLRLMFKYFLRKIFAKTLARDAQDLAGFLVDEYSKVLSKTELECFFGKEEARNPSLPIDLDQLKK